MLPSLGFLAPRHIRDGGPVARGASSPTACHVRGLVTSFAASTPDPPRSLAAPRASSGFHLRGVLLAPVGIPSRGPMPSCRSPRRFASLLKVRADASGFRALLPASSSFCRTTLAGRARRCLHGLSPSRAFSPSVLASASCSRPLPPHALGGVDVPTRLRLEVLWNDGVGWSLSGLPALLGFVTLRPSRHRGGAHGGRAYGFASRRGSLHAPTVDPSPLVTHPTGVFRTRPGAAVLR
jgi:hypothetical protein